MQPNVVAYNYPAQTDGYNQPQDQQAYQQQQPLNQGQGVPLGYPINFNLIVYLLICVQRKDGIIKLNKYLLNTQYAPVQQQQPFINGPVIIQPIINTGDKNDDNQEKCQLTIQQVRRANADGCQFPADINCPYCQKPVQTFIKHKSGCHTWLACWLLFLFFLPLFFLPFCFEECQDIIHFCPNCGKKVGKKKYKMCC